MSFIKPVSKGNLRFTRLSLLRMSMTAAFFILMICFIFYNHITFINEQQPFLDMTIWSWFLIFIYPLIVAQLIFQVLKMKDIRKFLKFMDEIDKKLKKLSIKVDHKRHRRLIIRTTFILMLILSLKFTASIVITKIFWMYYSTNGNRFSHEVCFLFFLFYESFFALQFVFLTYLLRERFSALKKMLR
ncbi:hypothetical protein ACKWTF_004557 [Chironomus riparius]